MRKKREQEEASEQMTSTNSQNQTELVFRALTKYFSNDEEEIRERYFLDSGNLGLNYIISGNLMGGYSSGLVTELFGDPSTGKTLLMMVAAAQMQKLGGIVAVADVEQRWDWEFAKVHGVDPSRVIRYKKCETVEDWTVETDDVLTEILKVENPPKCLFILDSIGALSTYWEMENRGTKEDQGKKAKRIKAAMRVIPKKVSKLGAILIASNHVIDNPQKQYGRPEAPGGRGFPFQSSIRLELLRPVNIVPEGKNRPVGATLRIKCAKSSVCPPFGEVDTNVFWSRGLDRYSGLLEIMVDMDIASQAGGWYEYNGKKFRAKDIQFFCEENPEVLEDVRWAKPYFLS